jgi:hypothetical protein
MRKPLSRRDFVKLGALALASVAARPFQELEPYSWKNIGLGRVTVEFIYIYERPSFQSPRIGQLCRDQLVRIEGENQSWYQIARGYIHRAYIQRVEGQHTNPTLNTIPEQGILGEVTSPYITSYCYSRTEGWRTLYRLYYKSVHWLTGLAEGPNRLQCYRITDYRLYTDYFAPTFYICPIPSTAYMPLSTSVPPEAKRIEISIDTQTLTAYEGDIPALCTHISSGVKNRPNMSKDEIPTETPRGSFRIRLKMPSRHMGDGHLTSQIGAYELPGVPWTMVFHETGVALHGTYWHNNFGVRMSHGCVNLKNEDALWLFRWTTPVFDPTNWFVMGAGTLVQIL